MSTSRPHALFTSEHAQQAVIGWYSDPGHAWLAVQVYGSPDAFDDALRFASTYSYVDFSNGIVYLEEDEDAPRFIKRYGIELAGLPEYSVDEESEIRNLPRGTKPAEGYCEHGTYVGGVMEDFMCGYCEA